MRVNKTFFMLQLYEKYCQFLPLSRVHKMVFVVAIAGRETLTETKFFCLINFHYSTLKNMGKFCEQWKKFLRASVASLLFEASFDDLLRLPFILADDMRNISANIAQTSSGSRVKAILGAVSDNRKYWFGESRRKVFFLSSFAQSQWQNFIDFVHHVAKQNYSFQPET